MAQRDAFRILRALLAASVLSLPLAASLHARSDAERFQLWVDRLKPAALSAGVSEATFQRIFTSLAPDCNQTGVDCNPQQAPNREPSWSERSGLPRACEKVAQKEFLEPAAYFPENYIGRLVRKGQSLLEDLRVNKPQIHQQILTVEATYGVPVPILMGLWARETALGDAALDHNAVVALASLAFAGPERRRPWMRQQLIDALKMVERGDVAFEAFRSSWAGATGLTQIMPSEYLEFAADGDGDGRRDIWTSAPDALATTANILRQRGWGAPGGWGRQVKLPESGADLDCTEEGRINRRPAQRWTEAGIVPIEQQGGAPLSPLDPKQPLYLMLPGGASGPALLVTENFDVLRNYNPSDLYALFIGYVGDRIGCDSESAPCRFTQSWPEAGPEAFAFSVENVCRLQLGLKEKGMLKGEADGLFGPQTRAAIGRWQKAQGTRPTCYPTRALFEALTVAPRTEAMRKDAISAIP